MSPSRRNSKFANSGIVVAVDESDWKDFEKFRVLAGMEFQKSIEQKACMIAGNTQCAPAQRMVDFVNRKVSLSLPETSYQPGLTSVIIDEVLPPQIAQRLRKGFQDFGKKMKGYLTNEAFQEIKLLTNTCKSSAFSLAERVQVLQEVLRRLLWTEKDVPKCWQSTTQRSTP
jgi:uncharacterized FAD-dependent dehydrogenase